MTYLARQDIINENGVNNRNLQHLIDNIYETKSEDKFGEIPLVGYSAEFVQVFLDHLETLPFTSKKIGYEFRKPLNFTGFKYSQKTDMFYTMDNGKIFKLPNYKRNYNAKAEDDGKVGSSIVYTGSVIEWVESDYNDYNGMSEFWTDMTDEQDSTFEVTNKWNTFIKGGEDELSN